jgi:hypothetical protein
VQINESTDADDRVHDCRNTFSASEHSRNLTLTLASLTVLAFFAPGALFLTSLPFFE